MAHTRTLEEHELQDFTEEGQQIASSQYSTDAKQQHPGTNGESTKPASNTSHGSSNNRYNRSPRLERADEERPRNLSNTLRTCCAEMYKQIKCSCKSFFTVSWNTCMAFFPQCWKTLKPLVTICWDTCVAFFTQCWRTLKPLVAYVQKVRRKNQESAEIPVGQFLSQRTTFCRLRCSKLAGFPIRTMECSERLLQLLPGRACRSEPIDTKIKTDIMPRPI
jgi:hypothetical protein